LIQLALDNVGTEDSTEEMTQLLARTAGRVVYLENEYGVLQAVAAPPYEEALGLPAAEVAPGLYSSRDVLGISAGTPATALPAGGLIRRVLRDADFAVCSCPISLGGTIAGFLTLLGPRDDMRDLDDEIALRAASAFAVPIAQHRAVMETQTRLQGSFLEHLLAGTFTDEDEIERRAQYLGHSLVEAHDTACLTLDPQPGQIARLELAPHGAHAPSDDGQDPFGGGLWTSFVDLAHREILDRWPRALLRERGDVLAVLLPAGSSPLDADQVRQHFEDARHRIGNLIGGATATIGLGRRVSGPRDILASYSEAEQAARIGQRFLGGDRTLGFHELGVYRVIARVEDRSTLDGFREEYLGPLEDYDRKHATELVETLEGFFACNGNHARAADQLHLHRNTLLYRLERVAALTGHNLDEADTRLSLQLALKIRRVFPTLQAAQPRMTRGARM
jgi:purine catabolism regulator